MGVQDDFAARGGDLEGGTGLWARNNMAEFLRSWAVWGCFGRHVRAERWPLAVPQAGRLFRSGSEKEGQSLAFYLFFESGGGVFLGHDTCLE